MSTLDPGRLTRALRRLYSKSERRAAIAMTITGPVQSLLAYRHDPVGFARDVLGVELTPDQQKIITSLPGRTKVNSGHSVGKTFCAAVTTLWWVYTRDPGVVITTAPTERDVIDLLWTEVRLLHQNARIELPDYFIGPRAAEMHHHENHWAKGYTARKGESLDADTIIDTPDGRARFGDLRPGDRVFGVDGTPTIVQSVHQNGIRLAYRVETSAGGVVIADGRHLWTVANVNNGARGWLAKKYGRRKSPFETITTEEIIRRGVTFSKSGKPRAKFRLPPRGVVQYPTVPVTIPAYTMGVWLGDGTCHNGNITSADPEIYHELKRENPDVLVTHRTRNNNTAHTICVRELRGRLRAIGLLGGKTQHKRVPRWYMENDIATRLAVLQGLMDTDGTTGPGGGSSFSSTSRGLVSDVVWLVRSLGGACMGESETQNETPC